MPSFTHRIPNLLDVGPVVELLITPSALFIQSMKLSPASARAIKVLGLIDTGASTTVIQQGLAKDPGINPVGTTYIHTPSSMHVQCLQFDIQNCFPKQCCNSFNSCY